MCNSLREEVIVAHDLSVRFHVCRVRVVVVHVACLELFWLALRHVGSSSTPPASTAISPSAPFRVAIGVGGRSGLVYHLVLVIHVVISRHLFKSLKSGKNELQTTPRYLLVELLGEKSVVPALTVIHSHAYLLNTCFSTKIGPLNILSHKSQTKRSLSSSTVFFRAYSRFCANSLSSSNGLFGKTGPRCKRSFASVTIFSSKGLLSVYTM